MGQLNKPIDGNHYCWRMKCKRCGEENSGCIRLNVFCWNCKEELIIFDTYKTDLESLKFLFISPQAIEDIKNWGV